MSATASQAVATTQARSIGGKIGLPAAAFAIGHGEIPQRPPLSPASDLPFRHSDLTADLAIVDKRRERAGASEVMNIIGEVKAKR